MHRFKNKVSGLECLAQYRNFIFASNSSSCGLGSAGLCLESIRQFKPLSQVITKTEGNLTLYAGRFCRFTSSAPSMQFDIIHAKHGMLPSFTRSLSSNYSSHSSQPAKEGARKDISTIEDPFDDSLTYNIPEKPVTFVEGASYSIIIFAGIGVAAVAAYAVFKELIFQPKEYKIFNKALERVQNDSQVRVRIGSPVTGYGQESRNRAARQRIPNRVWKDEDGVEHVEVNFFIRGPHGAGKVFAEMFRDVSGKHWTFTYLIVEILSPAHAQLMLESYVPS